MGQPITKNTGDIVLGKFQIRVGSSSAHISSTTPVLTNADSIGSVDSVSFARNLETYQHSSGFPEKIDLTIPTSEENILTVAFDEINPRNLAIASGIDTTTAGTDWEGTAFKAISDSGTYSLALTIDGDADAESDVYRVIFTSATDYEVFSDTRGQLAGTGAVGSSSAFTDGSAALFTIPANFFTGTWAADDTFKFEMRKQGFDSNISGTIPLGALRSPEYVRVEAILIAPNRQKSMYVIFPRAQITQDGEFAPGVDTAATLTMNISSSAAGSDVAGGDAVWDGSDAGVIGFQAGVI